MRRYLSALFHRCRVLFYQRNYFLAKIIPPRVPVLPLSFLPDGFRVRRVERTGLCLIDNFCTEQEAQQLIAKTERRLEQSRVMIDGKQLVDDARRSHHALAFGDECKDPEVLPFLYRGAMVMGLPPQNIEGVYVTRYRSDEFYKPHVDYGNRLHRLYTVLIYLNSLDEALGGATVFPQLNLAVQPRVGRAVCWTNINPDDSSHPETSHAAFPVKGDGEKWVIQLWFHQHPMITGALPEIPPPQARPGVALSSPEQLPEGAWLLNNAVPEANR